MALPPSGTTDEAFMREVDEEYRRERLLSIWRNYGRWIIVVVVAALIAFGGYLYWRHHSERGAGKTGEQYDAALRLAQEGQADKAAAELDKLAAGKDGYAAMARIAQGNLLLQKNDPKGAIAKFAAVAGDEAVEKPFRDLALIRQSIAEFDSVKPQVIIDRLKPLTDPNSPWLGTAGELSAAAYLKAGDRKAAGQLYGQIAQGGEKVPEPIRARAVQLAGVLGVDAIDQSKETKVQ